MTWLMALYVLEYFTDITTIEVEIFMPAKRKRSCFLHLSLHLYTVCCGGLPLV